MNHTMQHELGLNSADVGTIRLEQILTVGSRIFFQTHFFPLIKMQGNAREIYLTFRNTGGSEVPVLLNVTVRKDGDVEEMLCGGMVISNRNRFEKELLLAKNVAEEALSKNSELQKVRAELESHQRTLEKQLQRITAMHRQQQELYKVITHDLQEPLRKSVMFADIIISQNPELPEKATEKFRRIIIFNQQMRQMMLSLQRIEELDMRTVSRNQIEIQPVIDAAIVSSGIDMQKITVDYNLHCDTMHADAELLTNMFTELFLNSARHRNIDNEILSIHISAMVVQQNIYSESAGKYCYEDFIKLTFADDGMGFISDPTKVFNIFQRTEQFDRIGPGLAYCRKIIEMHHGSIIAKSIRGKGAGFTIFLPMHVSD